MEWEKKQLMSSEPAQFKENPKVRDERRQIKIVHTFTILSYLPVDILIEVLAKRNQDEGAGEEPI